MKDQEQEPEVVINNSGQEDLIAGPVDSDRRENGQLPASTGTGTGLASESGLAAGAGSAARVYSVSYTHLTLPTT